MPDAYQIQNVVQRNHVSTNCVWVHVIADQIQIAKCMIIILVVFVSLDIMEIHNKAV